MTDTFEEIAAREIDGLYQGALFLNAGDAASAEELLLGTLAGAFHRFQRSSGVESAGRWLEACLVRDFVDALPPDSRRGPPAGEPGFDGGAASRHGDVSTIDRDRLYRAAGAVPPEARAALWLVIFRRWTYAEAAEALGLAPDRLRDLLRYRHALVAAVVGHGRARNGTDHGFD